MDEIFLANRTTAMDMLSASGGALGRTQRTSLGGASQLLSAVSQGVTDALAELKEGAEGEARRFLVHPMARKEIKDKFGPLPATLTWLYAEIENHELRQKQQGHDVSMTGTNILYLDCHDDRG